MQLTNKYDLPQPIYEAIANDPYHQDGHISVTGLIKSPRMRQLEIRYEKQIKEDCSDHIYRLLGQAVHYVLQHSSADNVLAEQRLSCEVAGWKVTGQTDLLDDKGLLTDYKVTSVWAALLGLKSEWEAQDNCYGYLYRLATFPVRKLQIVAILRDWHWRKALQGGDYPPCACQIMDVPMWSDEKCFEYVEDRVLIHQNAEDLTDTALPFCTPEERWLKPTTFAVMKPGRKSALRVLPTEAEAEAWMKEKGKGEYIDKRMGESTRCVGFCVVKDFCNQYTTGEYEYL